MKPFIINTNFFFGNYQSYLKFKFNVGKIFILYVT